jgi:hypothetical protein
LAEFATNPFNLVERGSGQSLLVLSYEHSHRAPIKAIGVSWEAVFDGTEGIEEAK